MDWTAPTLNVRMQLSRKVWFGELDNLARTKAIAFNYVADFGCGTTGLLENLWNPGSASNSLPILGLGIDTDLGCTRVAQDSACQKHLPLLFFYALISLAKDVFSLKFNVIFCHEVFFLLSGRDLDSALKSIVEMLASDGLLVASTTCARRKSDEMLVTVLEMLEAKLAPTPVFWRTQQEYETLIADHGFAVQTERTLFTQEEYKSAFKGKSAEETFFQDESIRECYYCDVGKPV